jgi:hypothetical protein
MIDNFLSKNTLKKPIYSIFFVENKYLTHDEV